MDSSEGYRLLFYRQWMSLPLLVAALAACVLFVVLSYRLVYRVLPRRVLIVLACLRSAAVLLVLLLIFQPILRYSHTVFKRTSICILADTSRSMSVRDYPNSPSRVQRVAAELRGRLGQLGETFDLHLYTFDSIARRVNGPLPTEAAGEATDLSRAVTTCLAEVPRENLSALVILSDGIHNGPGDALQAILAASPPPIYTVGVGSDLSADSGFKDIGISALEAPDQATVNTQTEITVRVEATGFADRAIEVQIRDGRTVVAAGRLVLDGRPGAQALRLQIRPERTGQRRYEVVIPGDPKERIEENNRQEFYLMVTEPKIRVLYIETLRPEYGPLKRVLETDPNIDVLSLVQIQKGTFLKSGNLRGLDISAFPRRREQMRTFDVFIIGNLDSSFITRGQAEALRDLVREEGKGLLMIGGSNSLGSGGYGGTALEDALPVELGRRSIGQISQPFTMELTAEGREHPIFAGTGEFFSFRGRTAEKRLPVLLGCNRLGPLKPGAAVLAVYPKRLSFGRPTPVLVVEQYGRGRSAVFAGDTTYRWDLLLKVLGRESPYVKFWGQMVRYLASKKLQRRPTEPGLSFALRKPHYLPGEAVVLQATVIEQEGRATNFATVQADLTGPDGKTLTESLPNVPGSTGLYKTTIKPEVSGKYKVAIRAEKDGRSLGTAGAEFTVARPNQEFEQLSINDSLLRQLALASGGQYYRLTTFASLIDVLRRRQIARDEHVEWPLVGYGLIGAAGTGFRLTTTHLIFLLFLGLITAEWLIRRRHLLH